MGDASVDCCKGRRKTAYAHENSAFKEEPTNIFTDGRTSLFWKYYEYYKLNTTIR